MSRPHALLPSQVLEATSGRKLDTSPASAPSAYSPALSQGRPVVAPVLPAPVCDARRWLRDQVHAFPTWLVHTWPASLHSAQCAATNRTHEMDAPDRVRTLHYAECPAIWSAAIAVASRWRGAIGWETTMVRHTRVEPVDGAAGTADARSARPCSGRRG